MSNRRTEDGRPKTDAGRSALDWAVSHGAVDAVFAEVDHQLRRRRNRRIAVATGCIAALLIAGFIWQAQPMAPTATAVPVNAMVSMPVKRTLPDGSIVELKDGAQITFDYSGELRRVTLQKGEAHFAVAKNQERPFVVEAAGVEVRAVGTAFSVQLGHQAVEVLVTEGRVAIEQGEVGAVAPNGPGTLEGKRPYPVTFVDAGSRCVVEITPETATPPQVAGMSASEQAERLAWRVPRLEFSGTPLAQAIPMFNEHVRVKLVLNDASMESLELSGVLRADNTDSLLRLLDVEFGITAERRGEEIVLRKR